MIGRGLKYQETSDFIKNETLTASHSEPGHSSQQTIMTAINLKRRMDETESEDGAHIPSRFLDEEGGCSMHPDRPGVCYLYMFFSWLENEQARARVHAMCQFTGDCPGFYLADSVDPMMRELGGEDSKIVYDYTMGVVA